ncbi:MAG: glycosyltransferase family 4 protein [Syntrophales bacterium]|jgi:glycosyltransferase involved in cell wall biosynthesis|nr:glycosyltransferase family 4 protein [Syntrophales bacterium]
MIKKRIFCPVPLPPPYHGSNVVTKDILSSKLIKNTFDLDILPISYNEKTENVGKIEVKKIILILKYFFRILLKSFKKYDLVYYVPAVVGPAFLRDMFLLLPLKLRKHNILIHLHGKGIKAASGKNRLWASAYKYFFKNSSVVCLSARLSGDIKNVFNGPVYIVNNGIKLETYSERASKNKKPVILFLSNLIETKGVLVLLEAAGILKGKGEDFELNLVGSPMSDITNKINRLIEKHHLADRIISIGPKYGDEKKEAFQNADIFVLPTFYAREAFPLTILEAMQAGLPVISTDEGAIADIVDDGETGFLVKKKNPIDLAEKISILLEDENLRIQMGKKGQEEFLKNFTYEVIEKRVMEVFNKAIGHTLT